MFGFIFEIIIFIVIFRAILDSKKNRQRKQQTSQGATPPPVGSRPATPSYKPPVPNKPAAKKQKTGWTPRPRKQKQLFLTGQIREKKLPTQKPPPVPLLNPPGVTEPRIMQASGMKNGCLFPRAKKSAAAATAQRII